LKSAMELRPKVPAAVLWDQIKEGKEGKNFFVAKKKSFQVLLGEESKGWRARFRVAAVGKRGTVKKTLPGLVDFWDTGSQN